MAQTVAVGSPKATYPHSRILVVDDKPATLDLLTHVLNRGGYKNVAPLMDATYLPEAVAGFDPDLIILDLLMSGSDGISALQTLSRPQLEESPVMIVSSDGSPDMRRKAMICGASEYLERPFESSDVLARVGNLVKAKRILKNARAIARRTADQLKKAQEQAEQAQIEMLARIARIIDHSDEQLSLHTWRVARLAGDIAEKLGLPQATIANILRAARLHDLGKIVLSDSILTSTEPLTDEQIAVIHSHPSVGALVLSGGTSPLTQMAERIAHYHHERWDGKGYPTGLKGTDIPIEARIVSVADSYDAMTNDRPYRLALTHEEAVKEIQAGAGNQFDPDIVAAFLQVQSTKNTKALN